jgi:thioredoxin domain-containing protein 5
VSCCSWCGHCKRLVPAWDELGEKAGSGALGEKVHIGKVDCTVHRDVCSANGVRGYPTLLLFKNGNKEGIKYSGAREVESMSSWVKENAAAQ